VSTYLNLNFDSLSEMQQLIDIIFDFLETVKGCSIASERGATYLDIFINSSARKSEEG
jgi:hypothetical protein